MSFNWLDWGQKLFFGLSRFTQSKIRVWHEGFVNFVWGCSHSFTSEAEEGWHWPSLLCSERLCSCVKYLGLFSLINAAASLKPLCFLSGDNHLIPKLAGLHLPVSGVYVDESRKALAKFYIEGLKNRRKLLALKHTNSTARATKRRKRIFTWGLKTFQDTQINYIKDLCWKTLRYSRLFKVHRRDELILRKASFYPRKSWEEFAYEKCRGMETWSHWAQRFR